jgi:hypothetical protein
MRLQQHGETAPGIDARRITRSRKPRKRREIIYLERIDGRVVIEQGDVRIAFPAETRREAARTREWNGREWTTRTVIIGGVAVVLLVLVVSIVKPDAVETASDFVDGLGRLVGAMVKVVSG